MRAAHLRLVVVPFIAIAMSASACGSTDAASADAVRVNANPNDTEPRIIGGTPSATTQDSTVFVNLADGFCSGSLITPNLVITARHCVSQMAGNDDCQHFTTDDDPTTMGIVLGASASLSQNPTIAAHGIKTFHESNPSGCSYDIALIQLDHDLVNAPLTTLRLTQPATTDMGTAIGYGDGDDSGNMTNGRYQRSGIAVTAVGPSTYNYKTKANKTINVTVSPGEFVTGESTCFGDSGGPLLDANNLLIGVTSRGVDDNCIDRPSIWSDVYSHLALIQATAATAGHPLVNGSSTGAADAGSPTPTSSSGGTSSSSGSSSGKPGSSTSSTSSSGGTSGGASSSSGGSTSSGGLSGSSGGGGDNAAPTASSGGATTSTTTGCSVTHTSGSSDQSGLFMTALGMLFVFGARRRRQS